MKAEVPAGGTGPSPNIPNGDEMLVYLDGSGSMKGFVSRGGDSVYGETLRQLRNVSSILTPPVKVSVSKVDSIVHPPVGDAVLEDASLSKAWYNGAETNLAAALAGMVKSGVAPHPSEKKEESKNQEADNDKKGKEEAEDSAPAPLPRFQILITDGVQSSSESKPTLNCFSGSDAKCVRERVLEMLQRNWGCVVLGVRSQFSGQVFSEINRRTGMGSYGIPYQSKASDPSSYRPFYLYIFSPDPVALSAFVTQFRNRLASKGVAVDQLLKELPLSLPYAEAFAESKIEVAKDQDQIEATSERTQDPPRHTILVNLDTESAGPAPLTFRVKIPFTTDAKDLGGPTELGSLIKWDLREIPLDGKAGRPLELKILSKEAGADGWWVIKATAQWPKAAGDAHWKAYCLEAKLDFENQQVPAWVREWSTDLDTSADRGNRTLHFEEQVLGLWHNDTLKKQALARVYLRIGAL